MESKNIRWNWHPLVSVGPITLGEDAEPVIQKFNLQKLEKPFEELEWESYEFPDCETRLYVDEDSRIDNVGCYDNIYYNGVNLFGLTLNKIREFLGKEDEIGEAILFDFEDNEYKKVPVEFEKLGLQLWFEDDVVVDAMVYSQYDEE